MTSDGSERRGTDAAGRQPYGTGADEAAGTPRRQRLAAALRDNLIKRKAQARARAPAKGAPAAGADRDRAATERKDDGAGLPGDPPLDPKL